MLSGQGSTVHHHYAHDGIIPANGSDTFLTFQFGVAVIDVYKRQDIAEKIIRKNLDEKHEQMEMIDRMLDEVLAASKNN